MPSSKIFLFCHLWPLAQELSIVTAPAGLLVEPMDMETAIFSKITRVQYLHGLLKVCKETLY